MTAAALGAGALAIGVAPAAQAASTVTVFCSTNNAGGGGALPDPTTVAPDCTVGAGVGVTAAFAPSAFIGTNNWVKLVVSGDSTFSLNVGSAATSAVSADGKTVVAESVNLAADVVMAVPSQGVRTVSVLVSPRVGGLPIPGAADFAASGDLMVTGTGTATTAVVSQGYYAVNANNLVAANAAPIGIVHVIDGGGNVLDLSAAVVGPITFTPGGGTIATALYTAGDCSPAGLLTAGADPGATAADGTVTDACATAVGAGVDAVTNSGLWVTWDGLAAAATPGSYTASFTMTLGSESYSVSIPYVVSTPLAVSSSGLGFDATTYAPGALVTATVSLRDANGLIVPDGLGWTTPIVRPWAATSTANAPIYDPTTGLAIAPVAAFPNGTGGGSAATYNGVTTGLFNAPPTPMETFTMAMNVGAATNGWAAGLAGSSSPASARIGDPDPTVMTMLIVGERRDRRTVGVEGGTSNMNGMVVTPFVKLYGQTSYAAGTGLRTVADESFTWQRRTGKKIYVYFRSGDIRSNRVIIPAS